MRRALHVEMDLMVDREESDEEVINHLVYLVLVALAEENAQHEAIIRRLKVSREYTVRADKTVI